MREEFSSKWLVLDPWIVPSRKGDPSVWPEFDTRPTTNLEFVHECDLMPLAKFLPWACYWQFRLYCQHECFTGYNQHHCVCVHRYPKCKYRVFITFWSILHTCNCHFRLKTVYCFSQSGAWEPLYLRSAWSTVWPTPAGYGECNKVQTKPSIPVVAESASLIRNSTQWHCVNRLLNMFCNLLGFGGWGLSLQLFCRAN